ncbi:hypothetical protein [Myroides fluvii]|uniref:hypothetical protein n=1 Tax=Myroides fluvii TaxID=2572594 RepID=UPI00131D8DD2|nr:hypothetical protein [Myroides fluvii]
MIRKVLSIVLVGTTISLIGCKSNGSESADLIYYNGDIITMSEDTPNYVEAVAVKDGKILSVGTVEEVNKYKSKETKLGVSWSNCLFYFRTDADKRYNLLCLVYIFYLWVKRISYELTPVISNKLFCDAIILVCVL